MATLKVSAIYQDGVFKLIDPIPGIIEGERLRITYEVAEGRGERDTGLTDHQSQDLPEKE